MEKTDYHKYDAKAVLERLESMIAHGSCSVPIRLVCDDLSIFDWWPERLNSGHMRQMRTFLKLAIKLGYTGYVCFKVGASMCANGMWAHKASTTNGYSPKGACIYRSFSPDYTYYQYCDDNGKWHPDVDGEVRYDSIKRPKDLEKALAA